MNKRYSFKYKLRSGDNYKNLVQRFGNVVLGDAGIYGDEDLVKDKEYTFGVNTREEAETALKKDLEYQTQRNLVIARRKNTKQFDSWWTNNGENFLVKYYGNKVSTPEQAERIKQDLRNQYISGGQDINKTIENYKLREDAFWQGLTGLSDEDLQSKKETINQNAIAEELRRTALVEKLNLLLNNDSLRYYGRNDEGQLIFKGAATPEALKFNKYHTGRVDYLRANGNKGIIGRGLTLNNNTGLSYQSSMENLQDLLKLGQDLKDYAKTGAGVAVGLASLPALSPLSSVLTSTPVNLGLGAYGIYDSTTDMYNNGINLSNSIQLAGSILPYMRYTKIGNYINNWGKSTKLGLYFDPQKVKETSDALAATQKINPITASTRSLLLFRRNFPKIIKGAANLTLDMSAGTSGSHIAQKANENIDKVWNYNYDENGNVIKDINYYAKLGTQSALNTLGFTFGLGARNGNSFRNLVTSSLAYGPGTDLMYKGLDSVENKYNLKGNWFWDKGSGLVKLTAPVLLQRGLDRSISFGKQKLGSQLNLQDLMALNTTSKDAIIDNLVEEGIGLPIAYVANSILPDDVKDESTVLQLASMIGSRINPKHRLAQALESTAGALKYDHKTVMRTLESMLAGDLTRYRYTGTYENNDAYMLGSTLQGSIYGVEGAGKNKKGKGSFNKYDQSLGRNFAQRRNEALPISWWNLFSGSYVPTVGESFNADSKIVRFDSDYKTRNDFASRMAAEDGNSRRIVEIRNDSKILGNDDVPLDLTSGLVYGVPRSDGYFTGNNGTALNTVGANGVIYKDASGNLKGVLVVDYTNPGVRRVSPSNTWFGKSMHFLAHPIKSMAHPQKWLRGDFSNGDNYYNKDSKGKLGDLAYLGTSLATSLTGTLQRNKVFSTTGYKSFLNITDGDFMGKFRNLLFDPENKKLKMPSQTEINKKYKGTELESADFGTKLEHFINELNNYEGSNLGEKYQNYDKLGNVGNKVEYHKPKLKKTKSKKVKPIKDSPQIEQRLKNEHIMENWFSTKKPNFYAKSKKGKLSIDTRKLGLLFAKNKNTEIKTEYFLTLPEDVLKYIKDNYRFTLYKRGGKLLPNVIGL